MAKIDWVTGETLDSVKMNQIGADINSSVAMTGGVHLDSFTGATDDLKLTAALTYAAAQTIKPHIYFSNRTYTFTTMNRQVFSGMKLVGLGGMGDIQRSANSTPNDIFTNGAGPWLVMPSTGSVFGVVIAGLGFRGNFSTSEWFGATSAGVLWSSVIRDVGFSGYKHVLGSLATKLLLDGCLFDGWWQFNNCSSTAAHIAGADNSLWMDTGLCDTPTSLASGFGAGVHHIWFDFMTKTHVGPMYVTGRGVSCVKIDGGTGQDGALVLCGNGRAEGHNADDPITGPSITINGGGVTIRDWSVNFSQASGGTSGVILVTGGEVLLDGLWYCRATGVAQTVPFVKQTGGDLIVRNIRRGHSGGAWTAYPVVNTTGGTLHADDSVVVT